MAGIEIELQPMGGTQQEILQAAGLDLDADLQLWTTYPNDEPESSAIELQSYSTETSPVRYSLLELPHSPSPSILYTHKQLSSDCCIDQGSEGRVGLTHASPFVY